MSKRNKRILWIAGLALLISFSYVSGWPWNTDMIRQPTLRPYQRVLLPPLDSVPVGGEEYLPRDVLAKQLENPQAATTASVEYGKKMFLTYCAPCHGEAGRGHGVVAQGQFQPPDLTADRIRNLNDATIYGTITDGWLTMPSYREALAIHERWDVVNYVRTLQGSNPK